METEYLFQESGSGGCPFCRAEIKDTEMIVVDPFDPKTNLTMGGASLINLGGNELPQINHDTERIDE